MARARAPRRGGRAARARQRRARARARGGRRCCAAAWRPTTSPPRCAAPGARVVHAHNLNPALRLARAGRGARGGRARRAAPAQLPPRLRGRDVLQRRGEDCTRCHGRDTLPGRAPELPRHRRRGGGLRRGAGAVAAPAGRAGRRRRRAQRVRGASACARCARRSTGARPRRAARRARRSPSARARRPASTRSSPRAWRRRRASTSRSQACARGGPAARRRRRRPAGRRALRARRRGARFVGRVGGDELADLRAARGAGDRAVALGRDLRPRGGRGDGRRACRSSATRDRRAARARRRRRARGARRRRRARPPPRAARFGDEAPGARGAAARPRAGRARGRRRGPAPDLLNGSRSSSTGSGLAPPCAGAGAVSRSSVAPIVAAAIAKMAPTRKARW